MNECKHEYNENGLPLSNKDCDHNKRIIEKLDVIIELLQSIDWNTSNLDDES